MRACVCVRSGEGLEWLSGTELRAGGVVGLRMGGGGPHQVTRCDQRRDRGAAHEAPWREDLSERLARLRAEGRGGEAE